MHINITAVRNFTASSDSMTNISMKVMTISVVLTAFITLSAGVLIGSIITYCVMIKGNQSQWRHGRNTSGASLGDNCPSYEDVPQISFPKENFKMRENVAYGPAAKISTVN